MKRELCELFALADDFMIDTGDCGEFDYIIALMASKYDVISVYEKSVNNT